MGVKKLLIFLFLTAGCIQASEGKYFLSQSFFSYEQKVYELKNGQWYVVGKYWKKRSGAQWLKIKPLLTDKKVNLKECTPIWS